MKHSAILGRFLRIATATAVLGGLWLAAGAPIYGYA